MHWKLRIILLLGLSSSGKDGGMSSNFRFEPYRSLLYQTKSEILIFSSLLVCDCC